jgi:hypothetical protein
VLTLVRFSETDETKDQVEEAKVRPLELVVSGRDAAELLGLADQPLQPVALPIPLRGLCSQMGVAVVFGAAAKPAQ